MKKCPFMKKTVIDRDHAYSSSYSFTYPEQETIIEEFEDCYGVNCMAYNCGKCDKMKG